MNIKFLLLLAASIMLVSCGTTTRQGGMGVAITPIGGCSFTPPEGWVLDTKNGAVQGVLVTAYPKGTSYSSAPQIVYSRILEKDSKTKSATDAANAVVAHFRENGHSGHKCTFVKSIRTKTGKTGTIYSFSGDNWNNLEAACYFVESDTINSIVYHARNKQAYDEKWADFIQMCESYIPVFVAP